MSLLTYYTLIYFLIGTIIGFFLEFAMVTTGENIKWGERIIMVTLWPIMGVTFIWNFIKGLF
tara:strand:+ start:1125 stop:1310 length:186 start_codon:yes stop_codon:yes gene_type:complete